MSITMMCNEDAEGAFCDLRWSKDEKRPIIMRETHVGVVLYTGERNGYDDSDFYAVVWDDVKGFTDEILYASTRGWTYPNHASADATLEILQKLEAIRKANAEHAALHKAKVEANTPRVGKRVKVVGGRKVPHGAEGEVFWFGEKRRFGPRYNGPTLASAGILNFRESVRDKRVGIRLADESKVFVDAIHVEVV